MNKKNLLSGRDRELLEMAESYEQSKAEGRSIYMDAEDMADLAYWYAMRRKPEMAQDVVTYGLRLHPDNTSLLVQQAYLYLENFERDKAKEIAWQSISEDTAEVTILRAQLLLEEGQMEDAEDLLDTIEDKDDIANIIEAAYMYIDLGHPDKAQEWINLGRGKYDDDEAYLAVCADCCYAQQNIAEAMDYFNKLIDKNPYSPPYWFGLARCYYEQGQLDKAIDACDYANLSDEDFADAYLLRANAFYELGNDEKALDNYKQAERLELITPGFLYTLQGMDKIGKGEWQKAYEFLQKAIVANTNPAERATLPALYANAGFCLYKLGKRTEAETAWETAHLLAPKEADPYLIEGRARMEGGENDKATACWHRATQLSPYPETWNEIGLHCLSSGQAEQACQAFERVKEMDDSFEYIYDKLTIAYMMAGDFEKARHCNSLSIRPLPAKQLDSIFQQLQSMDKEEIAKIISKLLESLS